MALSEAKVPVIVASGLICFCLGVGAGALWMMAYGVLPNKPRTDGPSLADEQSPPGAPPGNPMAMMNMMGQRAPNYKGDLSNLVIKLDVLTKKPLVVELTDEQKKVLTEQLKGLAELEELKQEEAETRLNKILKAVEGHRETMEAAGYRWPGGRGGGPGGGGPVGGGPGGGGPGGGPGGGGRQETPNPFAEGRSSEHLKSLQGQLAKGPAADK